MLPTGPIIISVRLLRLFLQFFILVDAHCELTYLELRPLVFLKGQLCRLILFRALHDGARRKTFLSLLHRFRPLHPLYLQDYLQPNVVYLRFHPHCQAYYIGSSILSLFDREMSRKRKYRQLCSGINAYYEPALRYWKRTRTLIQHAVIPLQLTSDTLTTRSTEISFQHNNIALNSTTLGSTLSFDDMAFTFLNTTFPLPVTVLLA